MAETPIYAQRRDSLATSQSTPERHRKRIAEPVQVDTLDIRPLAGVVFKHFTARDTISRWDVVEVYSRTTATIAAGFLEN